MKKFSYLCIALLGLGFSTITLANEAKSTESALIFKYQENKEYIPLEQTVANAPEVVEFFSFYCPHCYDFEKKYGIPQKIKESLPDNKKLTKYHVNFMGGLSEQLSEAWAIAVTLGVEDKFSPIIFERIHDKRNLRSPNDIIAVFEEIGISKADYEAAKESVSVNVFTSKQENAVEQFKVQSVPTFYVGGKYLVNSGGIDMSKPFDEQFADIVNFLLEK